MRSRRLIVLVLVFLLAEAACGGSTKQQPPPEPPQLQPRETFDWMGEKISFSIPPVGWRREGDTSGVIGMRFVKEQSVGEAIGLGDYYVLADRNRTKYLREIVEKFDTFDRGFAWDKALSKTYAYTDTPFTQQETEISNAINLEVGQASAAYRTGDRDAAKAHLQAALAEAEKLHFELSDVISRVEFQPEKFPEPENYHVIDRRDTTIAGEPARVVDYTVTVPERQRTYTCRDSYVVHNSHLFMFHFIGLQETLAVFDAVIASIEFEK